MDLLVECGPTLTRANKLKLGTGGTVALACLAFHEATPAQKAAQRQIRQVLPAQLVDNQVAHVAELADALDSGSSE